MRSTTDNHAKSTIRLALGRFKGDLTTSLDQFSDRGVRNALVNASRLTRGIYHDSDGRACIYYFLSEGRIARRDALIARRDALTDWFAGRHGECYRERPEYQPARRVVRFIDDTMDPVTAAHYGITKAPAWESIHRAIIQCLVEEIRRRERTARRKPADAPVLSLAGTA